ncbi:hypothetical protein [Brumimicrobium mesophilum]|uniref:hypothetical protein n=1 Tax=Brumimicrobium mesophilum TaxID=392717 RepID=UPI000D13F735|nr:hypothetical protein [Brumimicrobium mesophilum]
MKNRYVIALNHLKIAQEQLSNPFNKEIEIQLTQIQVEKLMDVVRKYPEKKIEHKNLFTCGFSMN